MTLTTIYSICSYLKDIFGCCSNTCNEHHDTHGTHDKHDKHDKHYKHNTTNKIESSNYNSEVISSTIFNLRPPSNVRSPLVTRLIHRNRSASPKVLTSKIEHHIDIKEIDNDDSIETEEGFHFMR